MVFKTRKFFQDKQIVVVIRYANVNRLKGICFRGKEKNLAGNFSAWSDQHELVMDTDFLEQFVADVSAAAEVGDTNCRVSIQCSSLIGWSSTDDIEKYADEDLEEFSPSIRSTGLRVKKELTKFTAPNTNMVTVVYEIRYEPDQITVVIHSVYPGRDIGELKGNVSLRSSCVFFDWDHPGEV